MNLQQSSSVKGGQHAHWQPRRGAQAGRASSAGGARLAPHCSRHNANVRRPATTTTSSSWHRSSSSSRLGCSSAQHAAQHAEDGQLQQVPPPQEQQQQQQQPAAHPSASAQPPHVAATNPWAAALRLAGGRLQQGLVLAAASGIVLSMCLSVPAASSARGMLLQPQHQVQQQQQQSELTSSGSGSSMTSAAQQQLHWTASSGSSPLPEQQQQELEQLVGWQPAAAAAVPAPAASLPQQQQQLVFDVSSQLEDSLLQGLRQLEAGVDRAVGAVSTSLQDAAQAGSSSSGGGGQSAAGSMAEAAQVLISEVWEVVDNNYLDARKSGFDHEKWAALRDAALARPYNDQASIHRAVRDMLAQGVSDPYCRFVAPGEFAGLKKYDVTGVGLNLGTGEEFVKKTGMQLPRSLPPSEGEGVWVVGLSKGSEADRAGIQQGDQVLRVGGEPLASVSPFQASTLIAGPDDATMSSAVDLQVRKPDGQLVDVSVTRPARQLPSPVTASLQQRSGSGGGGSSSSGPVGVIRLTSFNARALRDVSAALTQLQEQGATELVLDLRDNRGGLVSEGLEVARLFLSEAVPIVLTQSKAMAADPPRAGATAATRLPLTVLVNEHTASASEILAGAIKDNCRGVLVGKRTYGKGLIQSVYELSDSSGLIITVGKYLTPRGVDIDRFGIAPDFKSLPAQREAETALNACKLEAAGAAAGGGAAA